MWLSIPFPMTNTETVSFRYSDCDCHSVLGRSESTRGATVDLSGFEINACPLARGDWKPRGMSRIFAQVVRRASGYFNLFCQLCVTMNETNYWNLTRKSIKIITNCQNNLVLATVAWTAKSCSVGHGYNTRLLTRVASQTSIRWHFCHAILICLTWTFFLIMNLSSLIKYDGLSHTVLATVLVLSRCCRQCSVASCDAARPATQCRQLA